MIACRYCLISQEESSFEVARVVKDRVYRRRKCRKCKLETQALRKAKIRRWVEDYKKTHPCARCGFSDFRALEFHHRSSGEKDFNVGDMIRSGLSVASIQAEMEKCDVLCANCHRIEHYRE